MWREMNTITYDDNVRYALILWEADLSQKAISKATGFSLEMVKYLILKQRQHLGMIGWGTPNITAFFAHTIFVHSSIIVTEV